ncbi:hypothetical protein A2U01_0049374, partial [Trifolium medium]|nr:hypothetical protein [Trifolium medium]
HSIILHGINPNRSISLNKTKNERNAFTVTRVTFFSVEQQIHRRTFPFRAATADDHIGHRSDRAVSDRPHRSRFRSPYLCLRSRFRSDCALLRSCSTAAPLFMTSFCAAVDSQHLQFFRRACSPFYSVLIVIPSSLLTHWFLTVFTW